MRICVLWMLLGVVVAACGDGDATNVIIADPASATTCEELADATVSINQELIDSVGDMSVEEFTAAGGPLAFEDWVAKAQVGASRVGELGCEEVLMGLLTDRFDRLEAGGPAGEFLISDFIDNVSEDSGQIPNPDSQQDTWVYWTFGEASPEVSDEFEDFVARYAGSR